MSTPFSSVASLERQARIEADDRLRAGRHRREPRRPCDGRSRTCSRRSPRPSRRAAGASLDAPPAWATGRRSRPAAKSPICRDNEGVPVPAPEVPVEPSPIVRPATLIGTYHITGASAPTRSTAHGRPRRIGSGSSHVGEAHDLRLRGLDGSLGEEEAPEDRAAGAPFGVEPVGQPGSSVREQHAERAVRLERSCWRDCGSPAVDVVEHLPEAVPQAHVGEAALAAIAP